MTCIFPDNVSLVIVHPEVKNWLKYARFEEKNQFISSARQIYERAVEYFGDENIDEGLLIAFAKFEEGQREVRVVLPHIVICDILSVLYVLSDCIFFIFCSIYVNMRQCMVMFLF